MGTATAPFANRLRQYTSVSEPVTFSPAIAWIQVVDAGSGAVVLKDEAGAAVTFDGLLGGEVYSGPFTELTSMTASKIRMGDGLAPVSALATVGASAASSLTTSVSANLSSGVSADTSLFSRTSTTTSANLSSTVSADTSLFTRTSTVMSANLSTALSAALSAA